MSAPGPGNLRLGVLLVTLLAGAAAFSLRTSQDMPPLLLNVSLDSPAEERWEQVMKHFDMTFLKQLMTCVMDLHLPKWVRVVIRPIAELDLELIIRQPYAGEIKGIAKYMGISPSDVFLYNLCYEMTAFCTSIIAQDREGHVFHGRNLDYFFTDALRKITVDLQFVKNGKIAYRGTSFVGYIGLWTAQKPYAFTISADARDAGAWWKNAIAALWKRSTLVSWLVRDVLSEAKDFQAAVLSLSKTPIIADVYYIVGGAAPGEGVVITRDRDGPADIWPLDPLQGGWFRVETNYDHWIAPPPSDDRRTPANKEMNATGQENINLDTIYKVLSVLPIINNLTTYTTVMSAAFPDQYRTRIRMSP